MSWCNVYQKFGRHFCKQNSKMKMKTEIYWITWFYWLNGLWIGIYIRKQSLERGNRTKDKKQKINLMAMWNGFLLGSNSAMTCSSSRSSRWSAFWKEWLDCFLSFKSFQSLTRDEIQNAVIRLIPNFCLDRPFRVFNPPGYPFLPKLPFQVFNLPGVQSFIFNP